MKTDLPRRERASSTLNALVRAARDRNPTDEAIDRISERLAGSGVFTGNPASSADATTRATNLLYAKIGAGLVVLAAGGLTVHSMSTAPDLGVTNAAPSPAAVSPLPGAHAEVRAAAAASSEPGGTTSTGPSAATVVSVDALPSVGRPPAPSRALAAAGAARSSAPTPAVAAPAPDVNAQDRRDTKSVATELELVQQAQAALASDPRTTLAITHEQARLYPDGEYIQEREVFAVEALSRLGRKEEAWQRAVALVRRFPRTPHAARLELATGRRLVPPANPSTASSDVTSR